MPIVTFYTSPAGHSIGYGTCQKMLDYIPVEPFNLELEMNQATGFLISCQDDLCYENFMKPYFYCAMDANCISPKGSILKCQKSRDNLCNSNCHRFDQSLINLLVGNYYNFDRSKYEPRMMPTLSNFSRITPKRFNAIDSILERLNIFIKNF